MLNRLTYEERERLAHAEGFTNTAELFGTIDDLQRTTAQLRGALSDLIQAIENGDPQTIANQTINASRLL